MPLWALSSVYALHMLATVVWIGGILYQSLFLLPVIRSTKEPAAALTLLERLRQRFQPAAWLSLAVLIVTGLIQMVANSNYQGFLAFENTWARAILIKHIALGVMILLATYQSFILYPRLTRSLLLQSHGKDLQPPFEKIGVEALLIHLNVLLSIIVLLLTSIARAA
ncbi:MAG: hypothetical protein E4G99_09680 [Anaerolineales bacterium]|nr:MAG: hypothetical protein E4G99_09680 [Anaerolineales bacterium]